MSVADYALDAFDKGWRPFHMDAGIKFPPPVGFTGYDGRNLDRQTLAQIRDGSNLAFRMSPDVVGIDVDAHDGKPGLDTFAELVSRLGELPPTWYTHSNRGDESCIRFFRVPVGSHLVTALEGIEMIQWFHRYAMVAPSVHPQGRRYAWFDEAADEEVDGPPAVDDLPELPWTWLDDLGRSRAGNGSTTVTPEEVAAWFDDHTGNRRPGGLKGLRQYVVNTAGKGIARHDTLKRASVMATLEATAGYYPAREAVAVLGEWWDGAFQGGTDRTPDEGEFGRLIVWAIGYAKKNPDEVDAKRAELAPAEEPTAPDAETKGDRKAPAARDVLVNLALDRYTIGRTEDERAYLVPHDGANVALFSGAAKTELARRHMATHGKSVGRSPLDEAWTTIEGYALDAEKSALPLRVATDDAGNLVLDLGDVAGRAVVIRPDGWELVDRSPVTFRRSKAMLALPEPARGGHVDELFTLLNVAAINRDLFTAWLTSTLFDRLPHPAPVLRGEQGAAKSSTARAVTRLIDPCMAATQKPPKAEDEWSHTCSARWIVAVDNVSTVSEWWSDALCRTVTGDGWLRRKLYEDDDVVVTSWRRCVILNGITLGASLRPDLAERLVIFELERPTGWLTESEVDARLDGMHARVLGALLDRAAGTLAALDLVEPVRDLRMADFATFLRAYDDASGTDALDAYRHQVDEAFDEAIAGDPLALAVVALMIGRQSWEGTTAELRTDLEPHRSLGDGEFWPRSAHHLSTTMTRSGASLRHLGIEWHRPAKVNGRRVARLTRVANVDAVDAVDADSPFVVSRGVGEENSGQDGPEGTTRKKGKSATLASTASTDAADRPPRCSTCHQFADDLFGCVCEEVA